MLIDQNSSLRQRRTDLQERTQTFAANVRTFVRSVPKTIVILDDLKQLIRSSGSVGANYIEARAAVSKKDFLYRIRICRKEAEESLFWLSLIQEHIDDVHKKKCLILLQEIRELASIFTAGAKKMESSIASSN